MTYAIKNTIKICALRATAFFLCLGFWCFIFSISIFGLGVWPQAELALGIFYTVNGFLTLSLAVYYLTTSKLIFFRSVFHPYVLFLLVIGFVSLLTTPFHDLPLRHVLGSVQVGEGVAWWLSLAVMTAGFMVTIRFKLLRLILLFSAIASFVYLFAAMMAFKFFFYPFVPFYFPDYLSFHIFLMLPVLCWFFREKGLVFWGCAYVLILLLNYPTANNIGIAYALLGVPFFVLLHKAFPSYDTLAKAAKPLSYAALAVIPFLGLTGLFVITFLPIQDGYYGLYHLGPLVNIVSRAFLIEAALADILDPPHNLLTGLGWGSFTEQISLNLPTDWLDFTAERAQWDGIVTDHFHSHNIFIEALFSAGIVAAILLYLLIVTIPAFSSKAKRLQAFIVAGALASLGSFWFLFYVHLPFIALALAMLSSAVYRPQWFAAQRSLMHKAGIVILVLCIGVIGTAGASITQTAIKVSSVSLQSLTPQEMKTACPLIYDDLGAGGLQLSKMMSRRLKIYLAHLEPEEIEEMDNPQKKMGELGQDLYHFNHLFCMSGRYLEERQPSRRLKISRLLARNQILISMSKLIDTEMQNYYYTGWKEELLAFLDEAPQRSDLAVPYLLYHLPRDEREVEAMATYLYQLNPHDPIALWFKGIVMLGDPARAQTGLIFMRRALNGEIERFTPVDPVLKRQLTAPR